MTATEISVYVGKGNSDRMKSTFKNRRVYYDVHDFSTFLKAFKFVFW